MQTAYQAYPNNAFVGLIADSDFHDVISRISDQRQLEQVVVTTTDTSQVFTVTINGNAYTYTSGTSTTATAIRDGLIAAIQAGTDPVTVASVSTDTLTVEETPFISSAGESTQPSFTIAVSAGGAGVLTLTHLVPAGSLMPFGVAVCDDENDTADANTGKRKGCRLPRLSTDVTGAFLGVTIADVSKATLSGNTGGFVAGQEVPILRKGRIWMLAEDVANVKAGQVPYVRYVTNTGTNQGNLGTVATASDSGKNVQPGNGAAQFTGQKIAALNLAVVEFNLP